jgi:D-alanyl-D-alanine dipeptidase
LRLRGSHVHCDLMKRTLPIESVPGHPHFRALSSVAGIAVELRYATPANFVGRDLYSPLDCAWLHRDGAAALERAVAALRRRRAEMKLLVLDALRPQRVQEALWSALEGTDLTQYLAPPARGSIHSFGMAIDITLVDAAGRELDMGTPFDDLSEKSHPVLEAQWLARGELTVAQVAHRQLLRDVMSEAGWLGITREWWHFDAGDREAIRAEFLRVL